MKNSITEEEGQKVIAKGIVERYHSYSVSSFHDALISLSYTVKTDDMFTAQVKLAL